MEPRNPESVAGFVAVLWADYKLLNPREAETLSSWATDGFLTGPALHASHERTKERSFVMATHRAPDEFETRVLVTTERALPDSGAASLQVLEVLLQPSGDSWAVVSLELSR